MAADPTLEDANAIIDNGQSQMPVGAKVIKPDVSNNTNPYDNIIDQFAIDSPSEEQKQALYGGPTQQGEALAAGVLNPLTLGAYGAVQRARGKSPEEIQGIKEANPVSYAAGQVGSMATGALGAGLLSKIAGLAPEVAGLSEATSFGGKVAAHALRNAAEAALLQSTEESSKMFAGGYNGIDPAEAAQTALVNMGFAGLIGGAIGGGIGAGGELWNSLVGPKVQNSIEMANNAMNAEPRVEGTAGANPSRVNPETNSSLGGYGDFLKEKIPNAGSVEESAAEEGITLPKGALSANETIRGTSRTLAESPSLVSQPHAQDFANVDAKLNEKTEDLFRDRTAISDSEVGAKMKKKVVGDHEAQLADTEKAFKQLEPKLKAVPVDTETIAQKMQPILDDESLKFNPEAQTAVKKELEILSKIDNVNDLKLYRTELNKRIASAYEGTAPSPEGPTLLKIKGILNDIREESLQNGVVNGHISGDDVAKFYLADNSYAGIKRDLQQLGAEAGLGKINNARTLLKRLDNVSNENFAKRFFNPDDYEQLKFFKEKYPELFDLSRRRLLSDIHEKSIDTGTGQMRKFNHNKALDLIEDKKISAEARYMLFPGKSRQIENLRNIRSAIPKVVNPSGTTRAALLAQLFSPAGLTQNLTDTARLAFLHGLPYVQEAMESAGVKDGQKIVTAKLIAGSDKAADASALRHMSDFVANTLKGENKLSKAAKAIFNGSEVVVPTKLIPSKEDREKLEKKLKGLMANQNDLMDIGSKVAHYMPEHGTALAQTAAQGVSFLNSIRPQVVKQSPLDSDMEPSQAERAKYDRALDIAQQPMVVMQSIKDGDVTPDDLSVLQNVYPALYTRMRQKVSGEMIESIHRGEKIPYQSSLGLSAFLGHPLDSTMTPLSIQTTQAALQGVQAQQDQKAQNMQQQALNGGGKSLKNIVTQSETPQQARQANKVGMA